MHLKLITAIKKTSVHNYDMPEENLLWVSEEEIKK